jgi:DNA-directed RNA polymerase specialized sigma54-like protein|tara:strand:- start:242 stop:448 length:207 start_codon:yes stop_codon:yes gene_type:complete
MTNCTKEQKEDLRLLDKKLKNLEKSIRKKLKNNPIHAIEFDQTKNINYIIIPKERWFFGFSPSRNISI